MNGITSLLVDIDRFSDYVIIISSITNLGDLFLKCVVFPCMDKQTIKSNHYFKYIKKKRFVRCIFLLIPVIGNFAVGIYDFTKKNKNVSVNDPTKTPEIPRGTKTSPISLDDVERIEIGECKESHPCQHHSTITLKDGRISYDLDSYQIYSIVSKIPTDKIKGQNYNAEKAKKHFSKYSKPDLNMGWKPQPAETVLNNLKFLTR